MPTINNYTFSDVQFNITEESNITDTVGATASLIITPNTGFSATASNFSATGFDTNYISSVVFTQSGSNVLCTINLVSTGTMPSSNLTLGLCVVGSAQILEITIAGKINAIIGSNITGGSSETNTPYSNSGSQGSQELLFTRSYNAATGYFFETTPSASVVVGNQSNYNIVQTPAYDSSNRLVGLQFNVNYLYPSQNVSGDSIFFRANANEIFILEKKITSYAISTSLVPPGGVSRPLTVYGGPGADFSVVMTDSQGNTTNIALNQVMDSSGFASLIVNFPSIMEESYTDVTYSITITGDLVSPFNQPNPISFTQTNTSVLVKVNASSSLGITGFTEMQAQNLAFSEGTLEILAQQTVSVSSGTLQYTNDVQVEDILYSDQIIPGGSVVQNSVTNSSTIELNDVTGVLAGDKFNLITAGYQAGYAPFVYEISSINGNVLTVSPNITALSDDGVSIFRHNGNIIENVDIFNTSGQGTSSLTFDISIQIGRFGEADYEFDLKLDNIISVSGGVQPRLNTHYDANSASNACCGTKNETVYLNSSDFSTATEIYSNQAGTLAPSGYYSFIQQGSNSYVYWTGTQMPKGIQPCGTCTANLYEIEICATGATGYASATQAYNGSGSNLSALTQSYSNGQVVEVTTTSTGPRVCAKIISSLVLGPTIGFFIDTQNGPFTNCTQCNTQP